MIGGFGLLAARVVIPTCVSVLLGNALLLLGLLQMLAWPLHRRTAVLSAAHIALLAPAASGSSPAGAGGQTVTAHGGAVDQRGHRGACGAGGARLDRPDDYQDLLQASLSQGLTFLVGFLCLIAAGFGFVLAVFERVARQMEQLANHDGLSGHPTRSATDAMRALELLRGRRAGHAVACVLLDREHFKAVNDRHGHRTAEAMLTPGPDGPAVRVTVSAGLAVADPEPAVSADRLYGQADQALYEAKRSGRNRVEAYGASAGASGLLPGLGAQ